MELKKIFERNSKLKHEGIHFIRLTYFMAIFMAISLLPSHTSSSSVFTFHNIDYDPTISDPKPEKFVFSALFEDINLSIGISEDCAKVKMFNTKKKDLSPRKIGEIDLGSLFGASGSVKYAVEQKFSSGVGFLVTFNDNLNRIYYFKHTIAHGFYVKSII